MASENPQKIVKIRDTSSQEVVLDPAPARRRRRRLWIAGGVVLALLAALAAPGLYRWSRAERSVSLEQLRIAKVTRGTFVRGVRIAPGQKVRMTMTLKVNGGSSDWASRR